MGKRWKPRNGSDFDLNEWERGLRKSLWHKRPGSTWSFLCPLCKIQRKVPFNPKLMNAVRLFQVGLTAIVFTLMTWSWFNWKGIISFLPMWSLFELVYRWRMRAALICPDCGFDPYLFLIDEQWAKREVEAHWRKKFADRGIPYPEKGPLRGPAAQSASTEVPAGATSKDLKKSVGDRPGQVPGGNLQSETFLNDTQRLAKEGGASSAAETLKSRPRSSTLGGGPS